MSLSLLITQKSIADVELTKSIRARCVRSPRFNISEILPSLLVLKKYAHTLRG